MTARFPTATQLPMVTDTANYARNCHTRLLHIRFSASPALHRISLSAEEPVRIVWSLGCDFTAECGRKRILKKTHSILMNLCHYAVRKLMAYYLDQTVDGTSDRSPRILSVQMPSDKTACMRDLAFMRDPAFIGRFTVGIISM